jgi:hypothetical protein
MFPESPTRGVGRNLALGLIQDEDARYFHAMCSGPTRTHDLSEERGRAEDQGRWIEGNDPYDAMDLWL